jgi:DNA mismatch repair protein MutL
MPRIRQLPPQVVNQIAAGEVIERPASVVKELMENAVDAGSTRIDVEVEQGGCARIRVADDGTGIPADELPLAVASHATSKLVDADDLFRVATLGFRGEALASIAAVSRLRLRSSQHGSTAGAEVEVVGGEVAPVQSCAATPGTVVEVSQLFFNTPVRRKFLRTTQTEMAHVAEAFTRVALAYPELALDLKHNGREVFRLPVASKLIERLAWFFGPELAEHLIWVESEDARTRLSGYVADPSQSRANRRMQYLLLNGRSIQDRSLSHALGEAYRGLLMTGRHPIAFLYLEMPPDAVDVNVHPTKQEVRFHDSHRLYSQLLSTLRTKFLSSDLTSRLLARPPASLGVDESPHADEARLAFASWATGALSAAQPAGAAQGPTSADNAPNRFAFDGASTASSPSAQSPVGSNRLALPTNSDLGSPSSPSETPDTAFVAGTTGPGPRPTRALQLHNAYLVAETQDGMIVIDQHALHERILYEQIRQRVLAGHLESQRLLVPEPVELTPAEAATALDHAELFAQLGLGLTPFGGDTVLVESYPAMLASLDPSAILRDLIALLLERGRAPDRRDLVDQLLHMIACKAAVKAGDPLTPEEVTALLEQRHLAHDAHHCPHGRPTALVFTKHELEKQFGRV